MAYEGKARALVALHREAEAEQALDVAVKEARAQGARAAEAQLLVVLGKQAAVRDRGRRSSIFAPLLTFARRTVSGMSMHGARSSWPTSTVTRGTSTTRRYTAN